ncbi:hypothetical protein MKK69_08425 [Methylobacterium sp. J-026]|uniref:DUF7946 domain-containing protein n=1 Tax=Methylobacterium sp. J-026 TaxID=2836624 RepID=UPI001FB9269D|nr:hypothetical protein [Methylobacterium sp. J-026]MCJ2134088.1 hypothetical protein [Methylobacterium sp. J-026]
MALLDVSPRDEHAASFVIRFDGLDAERHELDLGDLAESLRGMSRIIAVAGNLAATDRFVQHKDSMSVRVLARPPEAHCFEIVAWLKWAIVENTYTSATVSGLTVALIGYIFKRASGNREEMKHLKDSLDKAITELGSRDAGTVARLLDTVDRMAEALIPAVRQAVAPIGQSAMTLTVSGENPGTSVRLDVADRESIMAEAESEITPQRDFIVEIVGLSMEDGTCKLILSDDAEDRIRGVVTDPQVMRPNNPYALAMAAKRRIRVRAKAAIREGRIEKLFISDVVEPGPAQSR